MFVRIVVTYAAQEYAEALKQLKKKLKKTRRILKLSKSSQNKSDLHITIEHMLSMQAFIQGLADCNCEHCWTRGNVALEIVKYL